MRKNLNFNNIFNNEDYKKNSFEGLGIENNIFLIRNEFVKLWKDKDRLEDDIKDYEIESRGYKNKKFRKLLDKVESGNGNWEEKEVYWKFYGKDYEENFYERGIDLEKRFRDLLDVLNKMCNEDFYDDMVKGVKEKIVI